MVENVFQKEKKVFLVTAKTLALKVHSVKQES